MCSVENKFSKDLSNIKQQKQTPEKIRGIEVANLSTEKVREEKEKKHIQDIKMQRLFAVGTSLYLLFFALLFKMLMPAKAIIADISLGFQGLFVVFVLIGLYKLFKKLSAKVEYLKNKIISETLLVYAFIWMLITLVLLNDLPQNLFDLAV